MKTAAIITVTFIIGFAVGFVFARTARHRRGAAILVALVTALAIVTSLAALVGFIEFVSPTISIGLIMKLPEDFRDILLSDLFLRGTGFWSFLMLSGLLWWLRTKLG